GVASGSAATRAWAAALAAEAHASAGRPAAALGALDEAAALVAGLAGGAAVRYPWPDAHWLAGERGVVLARLGQAGPARAALSVAVSATGDERAVDRLRWAPAGARPAWQGGHAAGAPGPAL